MLCSCSKSKFSFEEGSHLFHLEVRERIISALCSISHECLTEGIFMTPSSSVEPVHKLAARVRGDEKLSIICNLILNGFLTKDAPTAVWNSAKAASTSASNPFPC